MVSFSSSSGIVMVLRIALAIPLKGMTMMAVKPNQTSASSMPEMMRAFGLRFGLLEKRLKMRCQRIQLSKDPTVAVRKAMRKTRTRRSKEPARAIE